MVFSLEKSAEHRPHGFLFASTNLNVETAPAFCVSLIATDTAESSHGCVAAGLFSAASLAVPANQISMEHLARNQNRARGVLVHAGIANVATGAEGLLDARNLLSAVAAQTASEDHDWLLAGTGLMGCRLPGRAIAATLPSLFAGAKPTAADAFARGILTTDQTTKMASGSGVADGRIVRVLGIAKGNRMVHPKLCTMLVFLLTDANLTAGALTTVVKEIKTNFEGISVDGVTSPADSVLALASGKSGGDAMGADTLGYRVVKAGMVAVSQSLCSQIVEDGSTENSAVRRAQVTVSSAMTRKAAHRLVDVLATNFLLKEALAVGRPCLGEVLAALSTVEFELDFERVSIAVDGIVMMKRGQPCQPDTGELARLFSKPLASVRVDLGAGSETVTRWISSGPALRL